MASLAFAHFVPEAKVYRNKDKTHYWNVIDDQIWDLTAEQFPELISYLDGVRVPRRILTKRAQALVDHVML